MPGPPETTSLSLGVPRRRAPSTVGRDRSPGSWLLPKVHLHSPTSHGHVLNLTLTSFIGNNKTTTQHVLELSVTSNRNTRELVPDKEGNGLLEHEGGDLAWLPERTEDQGPFFLLCSLSPQTCIFLPASLQKA